MLDLIEDAKVIVGVVPTTAITAGADWINTENLHCVWAICLKSEAKTGTANVFEGQVAESYAGASASTAKCKYWYSNSIGSTGIDRMFASTLTSGLATGTSDAIIVIRFDPSSADTSDHYFSVAMPTSGWGCSVAYICEPRYGGLAQFVATTSSTA